MGDAKQDAALEVVPTRRLHGNQIYTVCAMMAHNLTREIQMLAMPRRTQNAPKRPAAWTFEALDTLRHRLIQRAGRFTRPKGLLTLTMSANKAVRTHLLLFLDRIMHSGLDARAASRPVESGGKPPQSKGKRHLYICFRRLKCFHVRKYLRMVMERNTHFHHISHPARLLRRGVSAQELLQ